MFSKAFCASYVPDYFRLVLNENYPTLRPITSNPIDKIMQFFIYSPHSREKSEMPMFISEKAPAEKTLKYKKGEICQTAQVAKYRKNQCFFYHVDLK